MREFDFRREFADALFVCVGHGDGKAAWLVRGWNALVTHYTKDCVDFYTPPEALAQGEAHLTDSEEWCWSDEKESRPYALSFRFEDGGFSVYRLTDTTAEAARLCAEIKTPEQVRAES